MPQEFSSFLISCSLLCKKLWIKIITPTTNICFIISSLISSLYPLHLHNSFVFPCQITVNFQTASDYIYIYVCMYVCMYIHIYINWSENNQNYNQVGMCTDNDMRAASWPMTNLSSHQFEDGFRDVKMWKKIIYLRRDMIQKMQVGREGVVRTEEIRVHALPKGIHICTGVVHKQQ